MRTNLCRRSVMCLSGGDGWAWACHATTRDTTTNTTKFTTTRDTTTNTTKFTTNFTTTRDTTTTTTKFTATTGIDSSIIDNSTKDTISTAARATYDILQLATIILIPADNFINQTSIWLQNIQTITINHFTIFKTGLSKKLTRSNVFPENRNS